jgi:mannose-6-phosphate isomerase-like protein (cupin superfamily)
MMSGVACMIGAMLWLGGASAAVNRSQVLLENDKVRVKEAVFAPGVSKPGMHTHEYAHVGVVIDGGTLKFNYPDGKTETLELKSGGVGYREANVTHEAVNLGKKPIRVIEVEIK